MSSESVRNECPPTCPIVKKYIRAAIAQAPWLLDEVFPRRNDAYTRNSDVIQEFKEIQNGAIDVVRERPIDYHEKIKEIPSEAGKDIIEVKPIQEKTVVQERAVISKASVADRDDEKIDLVEEEEFQIAREEAVIPTERITDHDGEKIDLVEEEEFQIAQEEAVIPIERTATRDDEKFDLVEEEKLVPEIIQKQNVIPLEKIAKRNGEKIDLIREKVLATETPVAESVEGIQIERPEEIVEDEIKQTIAEIELELPQELEEYFEPEKRVEDEEEGLTDYEKFIDEELREFLPAVIAKEIPEGPRAMRQGISRHVAYEKIDRDKPARPSRERSEERQVEEPAKVKRIVSRKPVTADPVCDETCPLVKDEKERFAREMKEQQRVVDRYYLTKGFSYFEDVCTCSLACMVYTLSRDPFVRSVFASLALFAVGLKLCSELDAWEMPNRVS